MAQLPPDGEWMIQQIGGQVILFNRFTEEEIVRFNPNDADESARAQGTIHHAEQINAEQKSMAHFWSGYFYAHAQR